MTTTRTVWAVIRNDGDGHRYVDYTSDSALMEREEGRIAIPSLTRTRYLCKVCKKPLLLGDSVTARNGFRISGPRALPIAHIHDHGDGDHYITFAGHYPAMVSAKGWSVIHASHISPNDMAKLDELEAESKRLSKEIADLEGVLFGDK